MAKIYGDEKGDRYQWSKLKGEPLKVKIDYFFTYYGVLTAIIAAIIALGISLTVAVIRNSIPKVIAGEIFSVELDEDCSEELKTILCEKLSLNPDDYNIDVSNSVMDTSNYEQYAVQIEKIMARLATGDIDFYIADPEVLLSYMDEESAENGGFQDLEALLPEELFNRLSDEDRIIWLEAADRPIAWAIDISDTPLEELLHSLIPANVLACATNAPHPEAFIAMVELIYE